MKKLKLLVLLSLPSMLPLPNLLKAYSDTVQNSPMTGIKDDSGNSVKGN